MLSHFHINVAAAAAISVAAGWTLNVAWAFAADSQNNQNYRSIAARYGWACPAVLLLLAWAVWRFMLNHTA
jgi:Na+(H+)/acetate symporter ActP